MQNQYAVIHGYDHESRAVLFPQRRVTIVGKCALRVGINPEEPVVHTNRTQAQYVNDLHRGDQIQEN